MADGERPKARPLRQARGDYKSLYVTSGEGSSAAIAGTCGSHRNAYGRRGAVLGMGGGQEMRKLDRFMAAVLISGGASEVLMAFINGSGNYGIATVMFALSYIMLSL